MKISTLNTSSVEKEQGTGTKSSPPVFSPETDSFILVRKPISEINTIYRSGGENKIENQEKEEKKSSSTEKIENNSSVLLPNAESFILVRKPISEINAISHPDSENKTETNSISTKDKRSSPSIFSPNTESFVLVRKTVSETDSLSEKGVENNLENKTETKSISTKDKRSSPSIFSPNTESFALVWKPIGDTKIIASSAPAKETKSNDSIFSPNTESFALIRKPVDETSTVVNKKELAPNTTDISELILGKEQVEVTDSGKRKFLKLAGVASAGVIASQLVPKKAHGLILGSSPTTGVVGVKDSTNARINPATEETLNQVLKTSDLTFDGGALEVKIASVSGEGSSSFSDSGNVAKSALVDADRHVQVDVLSSALPNNASTETTLETISYGGVQYALRLETVGVYDYIGEAPTGTATSAAAWRIKRIDNTSGDITILWADGDETFDNVWDNRASLTYA